MPSLGGGVAIQVTLHVPKLDKFAARELATALRAHSPEIAKRIEAKLRERAKASFTQGYSQGAFAEDIESQPYTGAVSGTRDANLVRWYLTDDNQLAEWHRVYAAYQEGPPLGLATWTTGMHQIFARIGTDDQPDIDAWADAVAQTWAEEAAAQATAEAEDYFGGDIA